MGEITVTEMGRLLTWCLWMAAAGTTHANKCSFTNIHPSSTSAYMTLQGWNSGSFDQRTYTSPAVGYPDTSWFDCEQFTYITLRVYDAAGTALEIGTANATSIQFTTMSCQAVNMFTLEPLTFGSAQYDVDMDKGWTAVPASSCRLMLLNTGYDGQLYWEHRENFTAEWGGVSDSGPVYTIFGIGGLYADVNIDTNPG